MGPWNDFHGYMEVFPWVHGKVSVGHRAPLYCTDKNTSGIKFLFNSFFGVVARVSEKGSKG
jgi:hypothetical protein